MTRRAKKNPGKMPSINIRGIGFEVIDNKNTGFVTGKMRFRAEIYREGRLIRELQLEFQLASAWKLPNRNAIIKAHLIYQHRHPDHAKFMESMREVGEVAIGMRETMVDGVNISLMADANVIRYGRASSSPELRILDHSGSGMGRFNLYDSKAKAFLGIIRSIKIDKTIGGYGRINFSSIPGEVLESVGFKESPDILRRGISMWYGNPDNISAVDSSLGYYERQAAEEKGRESFLEMIQECVQ